MSKLIVPAALALALLVSLPLDAVWARGGGDRGDGGGGGGGFGGNRGGDRGSLSYSRPSDPSKQNLYDQARKDCSGARYPSGATPKIDYASNSYSCFEPASSRH